MNKRRKKQPRLKYFGDERCVECGKRILWSDATYIVRGEVWADAGMMSWDAGYLHERCLEKRLGRRLTQNDYLIQCKGKGRGRYTWRVINDYWKSPEYLLHGGDFSDCVQ